MIRGVKLGEIWVIDGNVYEGIAFSLYVSVEIVEMLHWINIDITAWRFPCKQIPVYLFVQFISLSLYIYMKGEKRQRKRTGKIFKKYLHTTIHTIGN